MSAEAGVRGRCLGVCALTFAAAMFVSCARRPVSRWVLVSVTHRRARGQLHAGRASVGVHRAGDFVHRWTKFGIITHSTPSLESAFCPQNSNSDCAGTCKLGRGTRGATLPCIPDGARSAHSIIRLIRKCRCTLLPHLRYPPPRAWSRPRRMRQTANYGSCQGRSSSRPVAWPALLQTQTRTPPC